MSRSAHLTLATISLVVGCALPLAALAQSSSLEATIRAALLKDPRSAEMSAADVDAMVALLAQGASEEGVSSSDIEWRAEEAMPTMIVEGESAPAPVCDGFPVFFCTVHDAFGFDGSNFIIPLGLLISSGLLWFLLYELRHRHRTGEVPLDN